MNNPVPESVVIGDAVIYQRLHDEAVLLDMNAQTYYGLDVVATDIWELLLEHGEVEIVVERLKSVYDTDEATLRNDVQGLILKLKAARLLKSA
jgi:hypothetical protein